jgi:hypothetical protein
MRAALDNNQDRNDPTYTYSIQQKDNSMHLAGLLQTTPDSTPDIWSNLDSFPRGTSTNMQQQSQKDSSLEIETERRIRLSMKNIFFREQY